MLQRSGDGGQSFEHPNYVMGTSTAFRAVHVVQLTV